jgi:hypothetical protein
MQEAIDLTGDSPCPKRQKSSHTEAEDENSAEGDGERHHDGELEVDDDSDCWADWDIDCHGDYYTENCFKREHPDGYRWNCCGALGSAHGCKKGPGDGIDEMYATSPEPELDEEDTHHPGELEVDYEGDVWADHDERCHGPIDTKTNRRENPDGFVWSCCGAQGTFAEGCSDTKDDE